MHATPARASRNTGLAGRALPMLRIAWCALAASPVALFIAGIAPALALLRRPCDPAACNDVHWFALSQGQAAELGLGSAALDAYALFITALEAVQAAVFVACGLLIFVRRADEPIALVASLALVALGAGVIPNTPGAAVSAHPALKPVLTFTLIWGNWLFTALAFMLPDGKLVPRWSWLPLLLWCAVTARDAVVQHMNGPIVRTTSENLPAILILILCVGAGVYGQIRRYRSLSTPEQRSQTRWIALGLLGIAAGFAVWVAISPLPSGTGDTPVPVRALAYTVLTAGTSFLPVTLAMAVLRHRLWGIDVYLNRAAVYGGATAVVVILYAAVVGAAGAVFHARQSPVVGFIAAALVAVLFQPIRGRLQSVVNRLMYGRRDDPYAVMARLGRRLGDLALPDSVSATVVATIRDTLRLPYVAIETGDVERARAATGADAQRRVRFPMEYQGAWLGALVVEPREGEASLSAMDRRLLEDLARQAGVAVHAALATVELQEARGRLVTAREEERRRLRRDLHDGLGPALAAIAAQSEAARDLIASRPDVTAALLGDIAAQSQEATSDIRRLVYNLRPPALDDLGLAGALHALAQRFSTPDGLTVCVSAGPIGALPAAVEVAAYHIAQEALANVVRHAQASRCRVSLTAEPHALVLEILDDGRGMPAGAPAGVGLTSMRERAEELGGRITVSAGEPRGTIVRAYLPLEEMRREP